MIRLDHDTHTYYDGEKVIKSVTQLLKEAGHIDTTWHTDHGRDRGSIVHEATEGIDRRDFSADDFKDEEIHPYLIAYETFLEDCKPNWIHSEKLVYSKSLGYAGMLDRDGFLSNIGTTLLDIKSGAPAFWHGLQLAAYDIAQTGGSTRSRRVLYLGKNGKYKLVDGYKGQSFNSRLFDDYWLAIAKKNYYDEVFLK